VIKRSQEIPFDARHEDYELRKTVLQKVMVYEWERDDDDDDDDDGDDMK
jgi:hypothetical protein